jgi:hypothetical protein
MRHRSQSVKHVLRKGQDYAYSGAINSTGSTSFDPPNTKLLRTVGTIDDVSSPLGKRSTTRIAFEVHPCVHTQVDLQYHDQGVFTSASNGSTTLNRTYHEGGFVWDNLCDGVNPVNLDYSGNNLNSAGDMPTHDWFSLLNDYREECNRLMPAGGILGESIVEHQIFLLPFQLLLNPSSLLKTFFKRIRSLGLHKTNLGKIKAVSKESASQYLSYQFGVKPALSEIRRVLSAHQRVENRIRYLSQSAGQWIPVRARQKRSAEISQVVFPPGPYSTLPTLYRKFEERTSVATISSLGKVRKDISAQGAWQYYVQDLGLDKILGLAWELVPFSFVVDWFTNAQERVNSLSSHFDWGPFTAFKGMCFSEKTLEVTTHYSMPGFREYGLSGNPIISTPNKPFPVVTQRKSTYWRSLKAPSTSGVFDLSTLGLFHAITGGALIIQRLP